MESWTGVARSFVVEAWEQRSKAISNVDIKVTPFRARTIRREILLPVFPRCIERRQTRLASRENPTLMNADVFNQGDWRDLAKCRFGDRVGVREIRLEARFRWPVLVATYPRNVMANILDRRTLDTIQSEFRPCPYGDRCDNVSSPLH